jgi:hypothetical protein
LWVPVKAFKLFLYVVTSLARFQIKPELARGTHYASVCSMFSHIEQLLGIILLSISEAMSDVFYKYVRMFCKKLFVKTFPQGSWSVSEI